MVARLSPLFEYSDTALTVVTWSADRPLYLPQLWPVFQMILRVIAASTCSQLGYMFCLGVSAYSAGVFHLVTHAFFKALCFSG